MKQVVVCIVVLAVAAMGCGDKPKPTPSSGAPDAAPKARVAPDAVVPPRRRPPTLDMGGGCHCVPLAVGWAQRKALRQALVRRMDAINRGLRAHMAQIDAAVPDEARDRIAKPAALHKARRQLGCRVDCVLRQFPEATGALWSYLRVAARFLDQARRAVARLAASPTRRPQTPSLAQLTRLFNRVARTSNTSIGLALLQRSAPAPEVGVDASSFKAKTRRWRNRLSETLSAFRREWLPLVQKTKPTGPALERAVRLRVALARLRQALDTLHRQALALACKRGTGCAKPQTRWVTVQRAVSALRSRLDKTAAAIRSADPAVSLAAGRQLNADTIKAFDALRKAALDL